MRELLRQVRANQVALISLVVAVSALGYTTWRNERTEANRNVRAAGFAVLEHLSEIDRVVFFGHYERDPELGNPKNGWAHVLVVEDLSDLIGAPMAAQAVQLKGIWRANWEGLGDDQAAADSISAAVDATRLAARQALRKLD